MTSEPRGCFWWFPFIGGIRKDECESVDCLRCAYHNFEFEPRGIRVRKAYSVRQGKTVNYTDIVRKPQGPTSIVVRDKQIFFIFLWRNVWTTNNQWQCLKLRHCSRVHGRDAAHPFKVLNVLSAISTVVGMKIKQARNRCMTSCVVTGL